MPLTPTAAKGQIGLMLEGTAGEQQLLAPTAIAATITGITAPSGSTGMRFHLVLTNWTASGSLTITGTGTPNSTETINVPTPTAQQLQSAQTYSFDYLSVNAYTAITNITSTGCTNGILTVGGIQAAKFLIPCTFKSTRKVPLYSPNEHTGLMARDKKLVQVVNETTIDQFDQDLYGDLSLWWPYLMMGAPVSTATIPAAPLSVVTSTTLSATLTIANQPTAPGMKLIIVVTSFTGNPSITINGTSYGLATSETITFTANGTYYSSNVYSALTSITSATNATNVVITGVFGWSLKFNGEQSQYTSALEFFDGTGSWSHPFSFITDGDFDSKVNAETKLTSKGKAQNKIAIGDRTTTPLNVNRITSLGQPLSDMPLVGWQTAIYVDPITGTPQSTVYVEVEAFKVTLKATIEPHYTFTNSQTFNRAYSLKRECTFTSTIDFRDLVQWEQFRQNLKQYLVVTYIGRYIGTASATANYESWTWTLPYRYDGELTPTSDPTKGQVSAAVMGRTEYDTGIGSSYQLVVITQSPPTYPN